MPTPQSCAIFAHTWKILLITFHCNKQICLLHIFLASVLDRFSPKDKISWWLYIYYMYWYRYVQKFASRIYMYMLNLVPFLEHGVSYKSLWPRNVLLISSTRRRKTFLVCKTTSFCWPFQSHPTEYLCTKRGQIIKLKC